MPIEIRELLIRTEIAGASNGESADEGAPPDREEIIEESVRRVLEILQKMEER
jgi:hypothetical protein